MAESAMPGSRTAERNGLSSLGKIALACLAIALLFAVWAVVFDQSFYLRLATESLILGGLAMSVDLLLGYCGLLSLGHAMFFGIGAYLSGLILIHYTQSFWLACLLMLPAWILVSLAAGLLALRSSGVYFALITFALAQVAAKATFATNDIGIASAAGPVDLGGSDGFQGVPIIVIDFLLFQVDLRDPLSFFLFVLAAVILTYLGLSWLLRTPFGRTLTAMRANERRLPHLGYAPRRFKLAAFTLSGVIACFYGALYPLLRGGAFPELLTFWVSGDAVISVIIGGTGTLVGPVVGTVLLTFVRSLVGSNLGEYHIIIIGVIFILVVIFFPRGLVGYLRSYLDTRRQRKETPSDGT
ncbi:MAG: branched-chain amino acid ABC transporter permease [Kiloniellales bacterium]